MIPGRDLARGWRRGLAVPLLCVAAAVAWVNLFWVFQTRGLPLRKDVQSEYLMAKALANGVDPYRPLPELAQRWLPAHDGQETADLPHPSPYPIAVGWLSLPLAALTYRQAIDAWMILEGICLCAAMAQWFRLRGIAITLPRVVLSSFLLFVFHPLVLEVGAGQMSVVLLTLFLGAWLALRKGADVVGGLCLGCLVVLKLMGGPILLWLVWRRRWRAFGWAVAVWAGVQVAAILLHGWPLVRDYYVRVGPLVAEHYRTHVANLSWWTLGTRLFAEGSSRFVLVPIWDAPVLAQAVGLLVPAAGLALLLRAAQRASTFDTAYALLMGGGVFVLPVVWVHYYVMLLPAVGLLFEHLAARRWPLVDTCTAVVLVGGLAVPTGLYLDLVGPFVRGVDAEGRAIVGAGPALLTVVPLVLACALLWQLARLDQTVRPARAAD